MSGLSEVYWLALTTGAIGLVGLMARMCYKSKCSHIECLGCIKIDRNTDGELQEDKLEINRTDSQSDTTVETQPKAPPPSPESGKFSDINPMKTVRLFAP
jgi:hypothetical protein